MANEYDPALLEVEVNDTDDMAAADAIFQTPPPLPDGEYTCVLRPNEQDPVLIKETKEDKRPYLSVRVVAEVAEGSDLDGAKIFFTLTSLIQERSGTSRLASVMRKTGYALPARYTLGQLRDHVERWLASEPVCHNIVTQWHAQVKVDEEYRTAEVGGRRMKGMQNFPPLENGRGHHHVVVDDKTGEETSARAEFIRVK